MRFVRSTALEGGQILAFHEDPAIQQSNPKGTSERVARTVEPVAAAVAEGHEIAVVGNVAQKVFRNSPTPVIVAR